MGRSQTIVTISADDSDPREPNARCERCGTLGTIARATLHSEPPLTLRYCGKCWPIVQGELQARQKEEWRRWELAHDVTEQPPGWSTASRSWYDVVHFLHLIAQAPKDGAPSDEDFATIASDIRAIAEEMSGVMPEEVGAFLKRHLPRSREAGVRASVFYRISAVLLFLFAIAHTLAFSQSDPTWRVDTLVSSMRSIHFDVQGFNRTYWDFFLAAGFSVGVFYLFAAILAWQLGGLPVATLAHMRGVAWAFALSFIVVTVLSLRYLFIVPVAFSLAIAICLTAAALLSAKQQNARL